LTGVFQQNATLIDGVRPEEADRYVAALHAAQA